MSDPHLAQASYTTIAIPSALAALLCTLVCRRFVTSPKPSATRSEIAVFIAVSAIASCAVAVTLSLLFVKLGVCPPRLIGDAALSAAIGGGVAAGTWHRSKRRPISKQKKRSLESMGIAVLTLGIASSSSGCAPALVQLPSPMAELEVLAPVGVSPKAWSAFLDVADLCSALELAAANQSQDAARRKSRGYGVSSVAGVLGLISGVTGAVLSAREDNDGEAASISMKTGTTAMVFGLIASAGGLYGSRKQATEGRARSVASRLRLAVSRHSLAALANQGDTSVHATTTRLGQACFAESRGLPSLHKLPMRYATRPGTAAVAHQLRSLKLTKPKPGNTRSGDAQ